MTCLILGDSGYSAQLKRRPFPNEPLVPVAAFEVLACSWGRKLNDVTTATITVPGLADCCDALNAIVGTVSPMLFELHIYRDPGGLVWAGPVTEVSQTVNTSDAVDTVTIAAKGPLAWAAWRVFAAPMPYYGGGPGSPVWPAGSDLVDVFVDWWSYLMSKDDPLIGVTSALSGVTGSRSVVLADAANGWTVLKQIIDSGVDVTEHGRTILVGGLDALVSRLPMITESWFADPPTTRVTGDGQATRVFARGGSGILGVSGGPELATGLLLETTVDDSTVTTVVDATDLAASEVEWREQALMFVEGSNALNPSAELDINALIPGAVAAVDLTERCVPAFQDLMLVSVDVSFGPSDQTDQAEKITVSFAPVGTETTGV